MALCGAELLIYPTAIGWEQGASEVERALMLDAWTTIQRSHAIANALPLISVNRIGFEPAFAGADQGQTFWGNSLIIGPRGELLARASHDADEVLTAQIDLARTEEIRRNWPFLRDRRIDAYEDLLRRYLD
jgi:N-carbamoylputrescine amidase